MRVLMLIKHLPITKTHFCESTVCRTSLFNKQQTYKISISSCIMFKTRMKFMLIFRAELYNYKTYCRLCTVVSFRFTPFVQLACAWYIHVQMRFVCKWFTTMSNLQFHKHMHTRWKWREKFAMEFWKRKELIFGPSGKNDRLRSVLRVYE